MAKSVKFPVWTSTVLFSASLVCIISLHGGEARGPYPALGGIVVRSSSSRSHHDHVNVRVRRDSPTLEDREDCGDGDDPPATRVDTTEQLLKLRQGMLDGDVQAYIVPMGDQHQSEYTSEHDKRVQFISGFSGSAGTAVITVNKSALWTDGRYHAQGELELDCNWILMKSGISGVPSITGWLTEELASGAKVGADPQLLSYDKWKEYADSLENDGVDMEEGGTNLVDGVWEDMGGRPDLPNNDLLIHSINFAGEEWVDKVGRVRDEMNTNDVDVVVITALDEVAWLFNLRGSDVAYNPVFFGYAIIEKYDITLYLNNLTKHLSEVVALQTHLGTDADGTCETSSCASVKEYGDFYADLVTEAGSVDKVWASPMSSYALYTALSSNAAAREEKAYRQPSIVRSMKGRKNPTEVAGLRRCHIRDAAALIEFLAKLEAGVKAGEDWTEISAAEELARIRGEQEHNKGLSFESISGSGPHGAIIHYTATADTDRPLSTTEMYLLDSGGQYLDGTTDVTRTFHFGTPNEKEIEAYTRVLMGSIDLAMAVWPNGKYGRDVDVLARQPLWKVGWDYRHGTGHGIGYFLSVHEGPGRINNGYRATAYEEPMYGEMFFSDEPGFYEDGEFGVRLETIVMTTKVNTKYQFGDVDYLGFEEFTLVPFETHLIDQDLLSPDQRHWLNAYHKRCLEEIGEDVLQVAGKTAAYEWVKARTDPIPETPEYRTGAAATFSLGMGAVMGVVVAVMITI